MLRHALLAFAALFAVFLDLPLLWWRSRRAKRCHADHMSQSHTQIEIYAMAGAVAA